MSVISLILEVRLSDCGSAKLRRAEVEAILGKLRRHFNVGVAELNRDASGEIAILGFAAIAKSRRDSREILDRVADAVSAHPKAEILKATFFDH